VHRVKGPACEPRRCAGRKRLEEFKTGDGCSLSPHRQAQIAGEFVRIELLLAQIKEVADEARDIMLAAAETVTPALAMGST
jgi:transposase